MNKIKRTRIISIFFSLFLFVGLLAYVFYDSNYVLFDDYATLKIGDRTEIVKLWSHDGQKYLFKPSIAEVIEIEDNIQPTVLSSSKIHSIFIETLSGDLRSVHARKANEEQLNIRIYDGSGKLEYQNNSFQSKIKGRGSSTWRIPEKKPYIVTLPDTVSVLGLGKSNKLILLANGFDESNIRNKAVYEFAKTLGFHWSPNSEYSDVYINGNYSGLYLVTEKVEVTPYRLQNIQKENGFLAHLASKGQVVAFNYDNWYISEFGNCIQFDYPKTFSDAVFQSMKKEISTFERQIVGQLSQSERHINIDYHSWAAKFLLDEFFENSDGDFISSYFYYIPSNNTIYGGPVWDYDQGIGNNASYNLDANNYTVLDSIVTSTSHRAFYRSLMNDPLFKNEVYNIYQESFKTADVSVIRIIDENTSRISQSSFMNTTRYKDMFTSLQSYWNFVNTIEDIKNHIKDRKNLLDDIYLNKACYHNIKFYYSKDGSNTNMIVKDGESLKILPSYILKMYPDSKWRDIETGNTFDFHETSITKDYNLEMIDMPQAVSAIDIVQNKTVIIASLSIILLLFVKLLSFFYRNSSL